MGAQTGQGRLRNRASLNAPRRWKPCRLTRDLAEPGAVEKLTKLDCRRFCRRLAKNKKPNWWTRDHEFKPWKKN